MIQEFADAVVVTCEAENLNSVLDLACGEGELARRIWSDINYTGIDPDQSKITVAKAKSPNQKFLCSSIYTYEGPAADLVVFYNWLKEVRPPDYYAILHHCFQLGRFGLFNIHIGVVGSHKHLVISSTELEHAVRYAGHQIVRLELNEDQYFVLTKSTYFDQTDTMNHVR
jgi:trans-aconitate methyltransferase